MQYSSPSFFLGANSPAGFTSYFDQLYNPVDGWFAYILKGGPGTGKSTLMKRAAREAQNAGIAAEMIYCSSDVHSLDAVIFPDKKICIVDGTAPHTTDPIFPGVADEIVNLGECWNKAQLEDKKAEIIAATLENRALHAYSHRYLAACGALYEDSAQLAFQGIDKEKVESYARVLGKKKFGNKQKNIGKEKIRLLSAITPDGLAYFEHTLSLLCDAVYIIEDEAGAAGALLLAELRRLALEAGWNVTTCYCPMSLNKKIDALLIPQLSLGFAVANSWHPLAEIAPYRKIHARRFMRRDVPAAGKQRLRFQRKAERELMKEAIYYLEQAKKVHDRLEKYYVESMDYQKVTAIADEIITHILNK